MYAEDLKCQKLKTCKKLFHLQRGILRSLQPIQSRLDTCSVTPLHFLARATFLWILICNLKNFPVCVRSTTMYVPSKEGKLTQCQQHNMLCRVEHDFRNSFWKLASATIAKFCTRFIMMSQTYLNMCFSTLFYVILKAHVF